MSDYSGYFRCCCHLLNSSVMTLSKTPAKWRSSELNDAPIGMKTAVLVGAPCYYLSTAVERFSECYWFSLIITTQARCHLHTGPGDKFSVKASWRQEGQSDGSYDSLSEGGKIHDDHTSPCHFCERHHFPKTAFLCQSAHGDDSGPV